MSVTFVTAFHPVRSDLGPYLQKFEDLVATGVPILLFLDSKCSLPKEYPNVRIIPSTLDTSWLPETVVLPINRTPDKDTRDYLALMLQKLTYMAEAVTQCETPYLAWIDFGLSHVIKTPATTWNVLRSLADFSHPLTTILVPGCWGPPSPGTDLWNSVHWRFCGGFFLGPRNVFASASARQMEIVRANLPRLTWEVNYWTMMEEFFTWYPADHNDSMLTNLPHGPIGPQPTDSFCPRAFGWGEYIHPDGEHHGFLTDLGKSYRNAILIDIGTHLGASAYSLSREPSNRVYSFDIVHKRPLPQFPNVSYHLDNLMTPEGRAKWKSVLLSSAVIVLDIDPHEGTLEYEFYEWLRDNDYAGVLVCDDIWHFPTMRRNFWYKIPYAHKLDVTDQAHWSGTGIVRFHPSERWPANPDISNWTVVTGYFDLTRMPDASDAIKERSLDHYLQHATSTLMLDQNMVIFCEPHTVDAIRARRPANLASKTRYIVMNFEDFPMSKYRTVLDNARKVRPPTDSRNTVSYYLLCVARYAMLKQAIAENPFGSTHFLWLNICIERMGIRNVRELTRVFQVQRDKFSTCYIDYQPPGNYLENVMRWGKCSMCSGFFTGNARYMKEFCDRVEDKFVSCALQGYGHADEQLFSLVYFDAPDIFEVYYGDYTEMITNYEYVKERASEPIRLVIPHSFAAREFKTCAAAVRVLWKSYELGHAKLTDSEREYLQSMMLLLA